MPTLPLYRELGIEVLLRGHAGELLHMDKAYNYSLDRAALELRGEEDLRAWLLDHLRAYMVEAVDGPLFRGDLERDRDVAGAGVAGRGAGRVGRARPAAAPHLAPLPHPEAAPGDRAVDGRVPLGRRDPAAIPGPRPGRPGLPDAPGPEGRRVDPGPHPPAPSAGVPRHPQRQHRHPGRRRPAGAHREQVPDEGPGEARRPWVPALRAARPLAAPGPAAHRRAHPALGPLPGPGDLRPRHRRGGRAPARQRPEEPHVPDHGPDDLRARPARVRRRRRRRGRRPLPGPDVDRRHAGEGA